MRDHVMREFDENEDRMLSLNEFEHGMKGTGAKNDQGWQVRSCVHGRSIFHGIRLSCLHLFSPLKTNPSIRIKNFKNSHRKWLRCQR